MALIEEKDNEIQVPENATVKDEIQEKTQEMENSTPENENVEFDGEIDLSATRKKRFRINGDNNFILELNTSDISILNRLEDLYPRLQKLSREASIKQVDKEGASEKTLSKVAGALKKIDTQMRQIIDEIFDSNVSEVCAPSGSMFDPFNGEFRYEHILDVITKLYESNINTEFKKMSTRIKRKTAKYTKGR